MSCGRHTTRRQAHATRRAKGSHNVRKASHVARRKAGTAQAGAAHSARAAHKAVRKISKTRPKSSRHAPPKKAVKRRLSAAQLKARNRRHKILSARARAHARAVATAKARAKVKAEASRRAAQKSIRSHSKTERLYCRVATRTAATVYVAQPVPPGAKWSLRARKTALRGLKNYRARRVQGPPKAARAVKAAKAG